MSKITDYSKFKNSQEHLEYIHIYVYSEIILYEKGIAEVAIVNYIKFELTDIIINSFNAWIENNCPNKELIDEWFTIKVEEYNAFKENFGTTYNAKVSIWSDRSKTDYYKVKLQESFIFENQIANILEKEYDLEIGQYLTPEGQYDLGENALGIEIKNDTLIAKYGNVYIEYQEKSKSSNSVFINSGILKNDNSIYFLIGTIDAFYIFKKKRLLEIFFEEIENNKKGIFSKRGIKFKEIATSKGFAYPVKNAISDTISIDLMVEEIKSQS
ncbi:hypothetical protein ACNQGO_06305 [Flavobacterium sp. ZT3P35]|uniref:hypothetical protein n=1 Tax=Flavobacterium sp. ZT3P35 TaxID=3401727 RepID=UPI003AAF9264